MTGPCIISGCADPRTARGLCSSHWSKAKYAGTLDQYPPLRTKTTTCSVDGCDKAADGVLCQMHRTRLRRTGTTDPRARLTDEQVYWQSIERMPNGCWEWTGMRNNHGYGRFRGKYAHRFGWELHNGRPIPEGLEILHSCDNPPCCNPGHLRPGTHAENMAETRGRRKGKAA